MNTYQRGPSEIHETVGAYALGILDDAEATQFEAHLATCEWCAQQLDELAGMEPMLAQLADLPAAHGGTPALGEQLAARPSERLSVKLVDEVVNQRAKKKRRNLFMLAASVILIAGGPVGVYAANSANDTGGTTVTAADTFSSLPKKVTATDSSTGVSGSVAVQDQAWGTQAVVEVSNLKGPNKCAAVFVGKDGTRETAASWTVPEWGYGLKDSTDERGKKPLYVSGGAAMKTSDIDHIEIVELDGGKKLVDIPMN